MTTKLLADWPVLTGVVTATGPVVAPTGTVAVSWVAEFRVKAAAMPSNVTREAPVKPAPRMTTVAPSGPVAGAKLLTTGAAPTTNELAEVAVPFQPAMVMGPVVVPAATVADSCVADSTVKREAARPLNLTAVVKPKFEPRMVTTVPAGPPVGEKLLMVGTATAGATVK